MSPSNQAAWLAGPKQTPFEVTEAPFPSPSANEVVVQNHAVAINPVDWKIQDYDFFVQNYPYILGEDGAGTVHSVGSSVTAFKPGDRVLVHYNGLGSEQNDSNSSFALYAKTDQTLIAKIPDNISFTDATVLPLAVSTASAGLFQKNYLGLPHPKVGGKAPKANKVVLIWGGSSSVGSAAIQLAVAAGVDVATTASSHNHDFVKSLGAKYVFDHTSSSVVDDVVKGLQGQTFAGAYDAISLEDTVRKNAEIVKKLGGKQFVATVLEPPKGLAEGVDAAFVFALSIAANEVGPAVWRDFLPEALKDGTIKAKPDALVVGKGLDKIQDGLEKNKKGVSAKKVVVELV